MSKSRPPRKMIASFLRSVRRFEDCADQPGTVLRAPPTEKGLHQFHDYESRGIDPVDPDPYFVRLQDGKAWWEWTLNFIAETYLTDQWDGWFQLARDFQDDPDGFRQLRQRCHKIPMTPDEFLESVGEVMPCS